MRLPRHYFLFSRVIDNWGDAGISWRLARGLTQGSIQELPQKLPTDWRQHTEQTISQCFRTAVDTVTLFIDGIDTLQNIEPRLKNSKMASSLELDGVNLVDWNLVKDGFLNNSFHEFLSARTSHRFDSKNTTTNVKDSISNNISNNLARNIVVIEVIDCDVPREFLLQLARHCAQQKTKLAWITYHYLATESWVASVHLGSARMSIDNDLVLSRIAFIPSVGQLGGGLLGVSENVPTTAHQLDFGVGKKYTTNGKFSLQTEFAIEDDQHLLSNFCARLIELNQFVSADISKKIPETAAWQMAGRLIENELTLEQLSRDFFKRYDRFFFWVSLFVYPREAMANVLKKNLSIWVQMSPLRKIICLLPAALADWFREVVEELPFNTSSKVYFFVYPQLAQIEFDALLKRCDLNCVRGEDSFVQAVLCGTPYLWQAYPQENGSHVNKLSALFEQWLAADIESESNARLICNHIYLSMRWNGLLHDLRVPDLDSVVWQNRDKNKELLEQFFRHTYQLDSHRCAIDDDDAISRYDEMVCWQIFFSNYSQLKQLFINQSIAQKNAFNELEKLMTNWLST